MSQSVTSTPLQDSLAPRFTDLTLGEALKYTPRDDEGGIGDILHEMAMRINSIRVEQERHRLWCRRADELYYSENFTNGGADLWANDPSATSPGRSHVSINTPAAYVDVPAALQAVTPIENMLATDTTPEARSAAAAEERLYSAWKADEDFELKFHKACTVKGLYGRTASFVCYDRLQNKPTVQIVEQTRNLYLGYRNDSYERVEWAAYVQRVEPNAVAEEFDIDVSAKSLPDGSTMPFIQPDTWLARSLRPWLNFGAARIEVWDYWYRRPVYAKSGKLLRMDTWNIVFAGNQAVRGPTKYPEYEGVIPYVPLFNTFLPGIPDGRAELYDMEQLIREKYERVTSGSQMIAGGSAGDYWQLVGPEAPARVPPGAKPKRNEVIAPGAGNRIETITPFIAQFQLEQFLGRLDREMAVVSGLNDLLLGLAPAQVLSSSKAINALISNYESRLSMRRNLLYSWRRKTWVLALKVWAKQDKRVAKIIQNGSGRLDIIDPSLSPRDEMETAQRAANLVNAKLWSQRRGMDATGVDDPETEQAMIREERTDATLFPADVQIMAQLMAVLKSLSLPTPGNVQGQAQAQLQSGQSDLQNALGLATPGGTNATQGPDTQGLTPPEAMSPGATPAGESGAPFAQGPNAPAGPSPLGVSQVRIQGGKGTGRILTQQNLGRG